MVAGGRGCVVARGGHAWLPGVGVHGCQGGSMVAKGGACVVKGGVHGKGGMGSKGGACMAKGGVCGEGGHAW